MSEDGADSCADEGPSRCEKLQANNLPHTVLELEEDGEVADLVRDFVEEHRHGRHKAHLVVSNVGHTDGQSICEVVDKVSHHRNHGEALVPELHFLVLGTFLGCDFFPSFLRG